MASNLAHTNRWDLFQALANGVENTLVVETAAKIALVKLVSGQFQVLSDTEISPRYATVSWNRNGAVLTNSNQLLFTAQAAVTVHGVAIIASPSDTFFAIYKLPNPVSLSAGQTFTIQPQNAVLRYDQDLDGQVSMLSQTAQADFSKLVTGVFGPANFFWIGQDLWWKIRVGLADSSGVFLTANTTFGLPNTDATEIANESQVTMTYNGATDKQITKIVLERQNIQGGQWMTLVEKQVSPAVTIHPNDQVVFAAGAIKVRMTLPTWLPPAQ